MVANPLPPVACPLPPGMERCPQCGQERPRAELWHKTKRLARCTACHQERLRTKRRQWAQTHRALRHQRRRQGGIACPPYVAWTCEAVGGRREAVGEDEPWTYVVYGPRGRAWPEALVTFYRLPPTAYRLSAATCSCGEAGCVHLVVACLAQQQEGGVMAEQFAVGERVRRKPRADVEQGFTVAGTVVKTTDHQGQDGVHVLVGFDTFGPPRARTLRHLYKLALVPVRALERDDG